MLKINSENNYGYLYVAKGKKYIQEAINSAKSLKNNAPHYPVCLITDEDISPNIFDQIINIRFTYDDNPKYGYLTKIQGMLESPYKKTFFVDTDTYFLENCDELFEINKYFDLMICHDYQENSYALVNGNELRGYHTYNTGVIVFDKNSKVIEFLQNWANIFIGKMDQYWSDQPAFMEALLYSDIKTYSLQTLYNFRFNQFLPISHKKVKILHGRHSDLEGIGKLINNSTEHRSWDPRKWTVHSWFNKKTFRERIYALKTQIKKFISLS